MSRSPVVASKPGMPYRGIGILAPSGAGDVRTQLRADRGLPPLGAVEQEGLHLHRGLVSARPLRAGAGRLDVLGVRAQLSAAPRPSPARPARQAATAPSRPRRAYAPRRRAAGARPGRIG